MKAATNPTIVDPDRGGVSLGAPGWQRKSFTQEDVFITLPEQHSNKLRQLTGVAENGGKGMKMETEGGSPAGMKVSHQRQTGHIVAGPVFLRSTNRLTFIFKWSFIKR